MDPFARPWESPVLPAVHSAVVPSPLYTSPSSVSCPGRPAQQNMTSNAHLVGDYEKSRASFRRDAAAVGRAREPSGAGQTGAIHSESPRGPGNPLDTRARGWRQAERRGPEVPGAAQSCSSGSSQCLSRVARESSMWISLTFP